MLYFFFFFFSSRRRHTRCSRDWSSDVCSSDLVREFGLYTLAEQALRQRNGDVERRCVRMLERERVEQAEEAVGDDHRVDLVPQELPGSERRIDPGVLDSLRVERNADPLDLGHAPAVEQVLHARTPPVA